LENEKAPEAETSILFDDINFQVGELIVSKIEPKPEIQETVPPFRQKKNLSPFDKKSNTSQVMV
jgi:hypothetical protein